jgi:hypothetical protein
MNLLANVRYYVVEDRDESLRDVLQQARLVGLKADRKIGVARNLGDAIQEISDKWQEIDLIFLDLSIPDDAVDSSLQGKDRGKRLLDLIHKDLNSRGMHRISVIIVSGEVDDESDQEMWVDRYQPTVIGFVSKDDMTVGIRQCVFRYCDSGMDSRLGRLWPAAVPMFRDVNNQSKSATDRSLAAYELGCLLLKNVEAYECSRLTQPPSGGTDLNALVKGYLDRNFRPSPKGGIFSDLRYLRGQPGQWILRGYMIEHLYSLLKYRNAVVHLTDTGPFHDGKNDYGLWRECPDVVKRLTDAKGICEILSIIVQDILEWYLPWHERVYLPWKSQPASGGTR